MIDIEDEAKAEIKNGAAWLANITGQDAGARFLQTVFDSITELARSLTDRLAAGEGVPSPGQSEDALRFDGWLVYTLLVRTSKSRARRSSSGAWRVYYILPDTNGDGQPETLRVVSVRHVAARPPGDTMNRDAD